MANLKILFVLQTKIIVCSTNKNNQIHSRVQIVGSAVCYTGTGITTTNLNQKIEWEAQI